MSAARHVVNVARIPVHLPPCLPCIRPPRSFSTSASSNDLRRSANFLRRVDKVLAEDTAHEDREASRRKYRPRKDQGRLRGSDKASRSRRDVPFIPPSSTPDRLWRHRRTLQSVQRAIQRAYGQEYTVEAFGSVRYGLTTENSDLDLVIMDPHAPYGWAPGYRNKMTRLRSSRRSPHNIRGLARVLQDEGFIVEQIIPWATVPIVKARDRWTGLHFDINVNDRLGAYNSDLIREYCVMSRILRPFMACTKHWAKVHGLNEPSTANRQVSFSSYSLALMAIAFLQAKGHLPNLQAPLTDLPPSVLDGHFWPSAQRVRCDVRFFTHRAKHFKRVVGRGEMDLLNLAMAKGEEGRSVAEGGESEASASGDGVAASVEELQSGREGAEGLAQTSGGRPEASHELSLSECLGLACDRGTPAPKVFRCGNGRKVLPREDGTGIEIVQEPNWSHAEYKDLVGLLIDWFKFWAKDFNPKYHMLSIRHGGLVSRKDCSPVKWQDMRKAPEQDVRIAPEHGMRKTLEQPEVIPSASGDAPSVASGNAPSVAASEMPIATEESLNATEEPLNLTEMSTLTSEPPATLDEGQRLAESLESADVGLAPGHGVVSAVQGAESREDGAESPRVEDGAESPRVEHAAESVSSTEPALLSSSEPNVNASECGSGSDGLPEAKDGAHEASRDAVDASLDAVEASVDAWEAGTRAFETSMLSSRASADPDLSQVRRDSDAERNDVDLSASPLVNKQWEGDTLCVIDPFIRTKNCTASITPTVFALFRQRAQVAYEQVRWGIRVQEVISGSATAYERLLPARGGAPSSRSSTPRPTNLPDVLRQYVYRPMYAREETSTKGLGGAGEGVAGRGDSGSVGLADTGIAGRRDAGGAVRERARPTAWGSPSRVRIDGLGRSEARRRAQGPQTSIHERLSFDSLGLQVWHKRSTEDLDLDLRDGVFGYVDEYEGEGMGSDLDEGSALPPSSPEPSVAPAGAEER